MGSVLPSLSALQTWVHRPQAIAKCFISDVYGLRALAPAEETLSTYTGREERVSTYTGRGGSSMICCNTVHVETGVFLLGKFPCKMVELVGWVAGVDHKESSMFITCPFLLSILPKHAIIGRSGKQWTTGMANMFSR